MGKDTLETVVAIESEYITLGQFLKFARIVQEGGEAKGYLLTHRVLVNDVDDNRRGRKLRPGDRIQLDEGNFIIKSR
jgi:S4 domain protein YaaA